MLAKNPSNAQCNVPSISQTKTKKGTASRSKLPIVSVYLPPGRRFNNLTTCVRESVLSTLQDKTQQLMENHNCGLSFSNFLAAYKATFHKDLNFQSFGFCSLKECIEHIPGLEIKNKNGNSMICLVTTCSKEQQIADIYPPKNSMTLTSCANAQPSILETPHCFRPCTEKHMPCDITLQPVAQDSNAYLENMTLDELDEIMNNIRILLINYPDGVYIDDLVRIYSLKFPRPLNIDELGFSNVEYFLISIAEDVPLRIDHGRDKVLLAISPNLDLKFDNVTESIFRKIPLDVANPLEQYTPQSLPIVAENEYLPICIGHMYSPSKLWILLKGENMTCALQRLQFELYKFYTSSEADDYTMMDKDIILGGSCAGRWSLDNRWYRVTITKLNSSSVHLLFVDYGTVDVVPKCSLRYLRKDYLKLPSQAIKSRMAYLQPLTNGKRWNEKAKKIILNISQKNGLIGVAVKSPLYPDHLSLRIVDASGEESICLNTLLINEGLARHDQNEIDMYRSISAFCSLQKDTPFDISLCDAPSFTNGVSPGVLKAVLTILESTASPDFQV